MRNQTQRERLLRVLFLLSLCSLVNNNINRIILQISAQANNNYLNYQAVTWNSSSSSATFGLSSYTSDQQNDWTIDINTLNSESIDTANNYIFSSVLSPSPRLLITINFFDIPNHIDCSTDSVILYDSNSNTGNILATICGSKQNGNWHIIYYNIPPLSSYTTSTASLYVVFNAINSVGGSGFSITVNIVYPTIFSPTPYLANNVVASDDLVSILFNPYYPTTYFQTVNLATLNNQPNILSFSLNNATSVKFRGSNTLISSVDFIPDYVIFNPQYIDPATYLSIPEFICTYIPSNITRFNLTLIATNSFNYSANVILGFTVITIHIPDNTTYLTNLDSSSFLIHPQLAGKSIYSFDNIFTIIQTDELGNSGPTNPNLIIPYHFPTQNFDNIFLYKFTFPPDGRIFTFQVLNNINNDIAENTLTKASPCTPSINTDIQCLITVAFPNTSIPCVIYPRNQVNCLALYNISETTNPWGNNSVLNELEVIPDLSIHHTQDTSSFTTPEVTILNSDFPLYGRSITFNYSTSMTPGLYTLDVGGISTTITVISPVIDTTSNITCNTVITTINNPIQCTFLPQYMGNIVYIDQNSINLNVSEHSDAVVTLLNVDSIKQSDPYQIIIPGSPISNTIGGKGFTYSINFPQITTANLSVIFNRVSLDLPQIVVQVSNSPTSTNLICDNPFILPGASMTCSTTAYININTTLLTPLYLLLPSIQLGEGFFSSPQISLSNINNPPLCADISDCNIYSSKYYFTFTASVHSGYSIITDGFSSFPIYILGSPDLTSNLICPVAIKPNRAITCSLVLQSGTATIYSNLNNLGLTLGYGLSIVSVSAQLVPAISPLLSSLSPIAVNFFNPSQNTVAVNVVQSPLIDNYGNPYATSVTFSPSSNPFTISNQFSVVIQSFGFTTATYATATLTYYDAYNNPSIANASTAYVTIYDNPDDSIIYCRSNILTALSSIYCSITPLLFNTIIYASLNSFNFQSLLGNNFVFDTSASSQYSNSFIISISAQIVTPTYILSFTDSITQSPPILFVSELSGQIYSYGHIFNYNPSSGQTEVTLGLDMRNSQQNVVPGSVTSPRPLSNDNIKQFNYRFINMECNLFSCYAVTQDGDIIHWGGNGYFWTNIQPILLMNGLLNPLTQIIQVVTYFYVIDNAALEQVLCIDSNFNLYQLQMTTSSFYWIKTVDPLLSMASIYLMASRGFYGLMSGTDGTIYSFSYASDGTQPQTANFIGRDISIYNNPQSAGIVQLTDSKGNPIVNVQATYGNPSHLVTLNGGGVIVIANKYLWTWGYIFQDSGLPAGIKPTFVSSFSFITNNGEIIKEVDASSSMLIFLTSYNNIYLVPNIKYPGRNNTNPFLKFTDSVIASVLTKALQPFSLDHISLTESLLLITDSNGIVYELDPYAELNAVILNLAQTWAQSYCSLFSYVSNLVVYGPGCSSYQSYSTVPHPAVAVTFGQIIYQSHMTYAFYDQRFINIIPGHIVIEANSGIGSQSRTVDPQCSTNIVTNRKCVDLFFTINTYGGSGVTFVLAPGIHNLTSTITILWPNVIIKAMAGTNSSDIILNCNNNRCFNLLSTGRGFTLEGFTIKNGFGTGGIMIIPLSPSGQQLIQVYITNMILSSCNGNAGTAIYNNGQLIMNNVQIIEGSASNGGVIYCNVSSICTIMNIVFRNNYGGMSTAALIVNQINSVSLNNVLFIDNYGDKGSALSIISTPNVNIESCNFTGNEAATIGGALYVSQSPVTIIGTHFTENTAVQSGGASYFEFSSVFILQSVFESNSASGLNGVGGGLYQTGGNLTITLTQLINNFAQNYAGAIAVYYLTPFIEYCVFYSNSAGLYGGAIVISTQSSLNVLYSNFTNNQALLHGGAIDIANANPSRVNLISNCSFFLNNLNDLSISYGGAISISGGYNVSIQDSIFQQNSAAAGGAYYFDTITNLPIVSNSYFIDNQAPQGPDHATVPVKLSWLKNTINDTYLADNNTIIVDSGSTFLFDLVFFLSDYFNQTAYIHSGSSISLLSPLKDVLFVINNNIVDIQGVFNFSSGSVAIIHHANSSAPIYATVNLPVYGNIVTPYISVLFQGCIAGQFVQQSHTQSGNTVITTDQCSPCPVSTYSIHPSSAHACVNCPVNSFNSISSSNYCICSIGFFAVSLDIAQAMNSAEYYDTNLGFACISCNEGGNCTITGVTQSNILPLPGYWPSLSSKGEFIKCLNNACTGGSQICATGYLNDGNLCTVCDSSLNYARSEDYKCALCPDPSLNRFRIAGVVILVVFLVAFFVWFTERTAQDTDVTNGIILKITLSCLQFNSLAAGFSFEWPTVVQNLIDSEKQSVNVTQQFLSFDCLLNPDGSISAFYIKCLVFATLPLASLLLSLIWFIPYYAIKLRKEKKNQIRDMDVNYTTNTQINNNAQTHNIINPSASDYMINNNNIQDKIPNNIVPNEDNKTKDLYKVEVTREIEMVPVIVKHDNFIESKDPNNESKSEVIEAIEFHSIQPKNTNSTSLVTTIVPVTMVTPADVNNTIDTTHPTETINNNTWGVSLNLRKCSDWSHSFYFFNSVKSSYISSSVIILFLFHPYLVQQTFQMFACKNLDYDNTVVSSSSENTSNNNDSYLLADLTQRCFTSNHLLWIFTVGLFMLTVYVIGTVDIRLEYYDFPKTITVPILFILYILFYILY